MITLKMLNILFWNWKPYLLSYTYKLITLTRVGASIKLRYSKKKIYIYCFQGIPYSDTPNGASVFYILVVERQP